MYKHLLSFIFLLGVFNAAFAQEELPDVFPPAPTAAELGKFGTYPVDLASGMPQIEIPLYTVTSGDIQVPISLKYHASGIKVTQMPSWVGLGWALNTGGAISLETRDTPDELEPDPYTPPNITTLTNTINANPHDYFDPDVINATTYSWVKDAYHISLPTVSGTFFLDSDNDGEVTTKFPPDQFKIYRHKNVNASNPYLYKVLDKQGMQYEFVDYEQSQLNKPIGGGATHSHNTPYKSAWLLNKISNTKGDVLTYTYGTQHTNISFGESHSQSYSMTEDYGGDGGAFVGYIPNLSSWTSSNSTSLSFSNKIQEINFPNGRLRFITASNIQYVGADGTSGVYLDKIIVEQGSASSGYSEIKTIHFDYSTTGSPTNYLGVNKYRFKLDRVYEVYGPSDEKDIVNLEYSSVQLPNLRSYSQDYFGHYNGKTNGNLIPSRTVQLPSTGTLYQIGEADRSIDLTKMQAGMLTKIKYPTKGYTAFAYEPNTFYGKNIFIKDETVNETMDIVGVGNGGNLPLPGQVQIETFNFNLNEATNLYLTGSLTCTGCDPINAKYAYAKIKVVNNSTEKLNFNGYSNNYAQTVALSPGSVTVTLEVYGSLVEAHITAAYLNKTGNLPDENVQGFGLRIKSITNYDANHDFLTQKAYTYNTPGTSNSSGKLVNSHFMYDRYSDFKFFNKGGGDCIYTVKDTYTYGASSRSGMENNSITYEYVTEWDKDALGNTNGRTAYKYTITPNTIADNNNGSIRANLGHERGQLLKKEIYNEQNKILTKEEHDYSQNLNVSNTRTDFKMYSRKSANISTHPGCPEPPFILSETKELLNSSLPVYWYKKDKTDVTQYFYNSSGTLEHQTLTTTNYTYNNTNQEVQKTTTTNSQGDILETSYTYAQDLNDTQLIADNRISIPLETKVMDGAQIVSHSKTNYAVSGTLYLPKDFFNKKGALVNVSNSYEKVYTINDYDDGRIIQYQKEDGIPTSIIWGYNEQYPIAKIENATYTQVSGQVANLQSKSNLDDDHCLDSENCDEKNLRTALTSLRNSLPNAMVTTYTYDPLIGITSMTDPKGYTTYYVYDGFNRLRYIKNKDGEVQAENKYHYKLDDILATTTASSTSVNSGDTVTLTTNASGGTGNFAYKWTVSNGNLNQVFNTSVGTLNITTTASHTPSFSVTCEVTDTTINESVSTVTQIDVSSGPPPLSVNGITVSPVGAKEVDQYVTYSVTASGGSGNYSYVWSKTSNQSTITYSGTTASSKTIRIKPLDCPGFTIKCVITDTTTNEVITKEVFISVGFGCSGGGPTF